LTRKHFFQEAYAQRRKQVGKYMVLWLRTGDDANLRLGVVSSRKVGNAVRRNRARRRLREIFRRHRHRLRGPVDVVLVARYGVVDAPWQAITEELLRLTQRAGILKKNRNEWETNE
jgi:ribonuclease P protein component